MNFSKICFSLVFVFLSGVIQAKNYYLNVADGKDEHTGTSVKEPWKSIDKLNGVSLLPGDSILFACGQKFTGMLKLEGVSGTELSPIVISRYAYKGDTSKPQIDAGQQLHTFWIQNARYLKMEGLELTASEPYSGLKNNSKEWVRCGILVEITQSNYFQGIVIENVWVHDVFISPKGTTRSASETRTANGSQSYGWGIRFINNTPSGKLAGVVVSNSWISAVSHTGLKFTCTKGGISDINIFNNTIQNTGGPGLQMSGVVNGHIHHNSINRSGSTADSRNWGRGSGMWTWGSSMILIEHNEFKNANGPGDSAGVHIDFNCNDVVVQYNFSMNNAGGFCEILGNNYNCAYRYNISVNDGNRTKGKNGAFQEGKIFWLSGYQGNQKGKAGPYNSYFYNNTIYVSDSIVPKIAVSTSAKGVLIANNIFYFEGPSLAVSGDQKPIEMDTGTVENVVFHNNLFLRKDNWPERISIQDASPLFGDPGFKNKGSVREADYTCLNYKLVKDKGVEILPVSGDTIGLKIGLKVQYDILGNPVKGLPDMGAIEVK